jgi:hypothetical protein
LGPVGSDDVDRISVHDGELVRSIDIRLLQGVRNAVRDQELIAWSQDESHADFGLFLALFDVVDLEEGNTAPMRDGAIYVSPLAQMVRMHEQRRTSHVLLTELGENWGAFSTTVPNRTVDWGDWQAHLAKDGCTPERVRRYLDDPAVKAVVTPQHTIFPHPSILSLPIGVRLAQKIAQHIARADGTKTQDLMINNSGWQHRHQINQRVSANFGGRIQNTYGLGQSEYYAAIAGSRFVLCPSGMGWDSYRIWETLLLGSIPVVEASAGWDTVLVDLPALVVSHFDAVTPARLGSAYPLILSRCDRYDYGKLTKRWWAQRITGLLAAP